MVACASCSGQTPSGYKFCQHCGAPLPTMQAPTAASASTGAGATPPTIIGGQVPKDPAASTQLPEGSVAGPASDLPESAARTIIDMDGQMMAQQMADHQAAPQAQQPSPANPFAQPPSGAAPQHTPPAGMPPGQPSAVMSPDFDPDAATVPPQTDEQVAREGERTIGPGAGVASSQPGDEPLAVLARLVSVRRDGSDGEQTEVREEAFDIGRSQGQLQFNDDPYLAPRHCRLFLRDGAWVLQDLTTANGVYRRFTQPRPLEDGEQLLLGKQVLKFERLATHEADLAPAVEHGVMIFGSPLKSPWGRLKQLTVAGIYRDVYHCDRPQVTFGREDGDVVFPDDEFMSRKHMAVSFVDEKVLVQDLGSSNGTFLKIDGEVELSAGDVLRLGDQLLRFELA